MGQKFIIRQGVIMAKRFMNYGILFSVLGVFGSMYLFLIAENNWLQIISSLIFFAINLLNIFDSNRLYLDICKQEQRSDSNFIAQNKALRDLELSMKALDIQCYLNLNAFKQKVNQGFEDVIQMELAQINYERRK